MSPKPYAEILSMIPRRALPLAPIIPPSFVILGRLLAFKSYSRSPRFLFLALPVEARGRGLEAFTDIVCLAGSGAAIGLAGSELDRQCLELLLVHQVLVAAVAE